MVSLPLPGGGRPIGGLLRGTFLVAVLALSAGCGGADGHEWDAGPPVESGKVPAGLPVSAADAVEPPAPDRDTATAPVDPRGDEAGRPGSVEAGDTLPGTVEAGARGATSAVEPDPAPADPPSFRRPEHIRGIYLNAWASGSTVRTEALIELARRTEINTFVIDVKDDTGFMSYPTRVGLAREIGADQELRIRNVGRLLRRLEEEGIYPIARIVVFKDHLLAEQKPEMAVQDSTGGPWIDGRGDVWVNPYDERVWQYHVEVAREAVELGFPEVQWDYVRFPDRPQSELRRAVFPGNEGRSRSHAIRDFLIWSADELSDLDVPLTADVFGMATSATNDVGIGQLWEDFIDVVDVALPMIYPSHYGAGSFGIQMPNAHPYEIVAAALRHAVRRNEQVDNPGRIIPWLQDFTLGPPRYEAPEVRAQILATYDAGIHEWILWNSAGRYTEEALEPKGGWAGGKEPLIRFGGEVVPSSERFAPQVPDTVLEDPPGGRSR